MPPKPGISRVIWTATILAAGFTAESRSGADEVPARKMDPWTELSRLLVNEAHAQFHREAATAPERTTRFGLALALLNVQPKTQGNIDRAEEIFRDLAAQGSDDDLTVQSLYYFARIPAFQRPEPLEDLAITRFDELIRRFPDHPLAQQALLKQAMMRLYSIDSEAGRDERFETALALEPRFTDPEARRDYFLMMADAAIEFGRPPGQVLEFLLGAERTGTLKAKLRKDTFLRIAEFAREAGARDTAIAFYEKFLALAQRDGRRYTVQERLAALRNPAP